MRAVPHIRDDGATVEVDLHGLTVDDAVYFAGRLLSVAIRRGRTRLTFIHGASTSDPRLRNRTIKHALQDWAATVPHSGSVQALDSQLHFHFLPGSATDPRRIGPRDLT
jgi:DNA-nicking Smr family endonuclease